MHLLRIIITIVIVIVIVIVTIVITASIVNGVHFQTFPPQLTHVRSRIHSFIDTNRTTIIESLKYAVTGSLPPGKNPGQSFVHDPKAVGQSVVKANVKLRFTNRAGSSMVLVRSMELTQRKTTLSFKALDGVLRTMDPNTGERLSMSHKCTELDRQIPVLLGVSKPILEHVVFCHQEDSSWPLMDSTVLKKRFDDIFDSTRYTKALKNLQEIKKMHQSDAKDLKADLAGLASHKHAAKGFRQELEQQQNSLEELEEEVDKYQQEINKTDKVQRKQQKILERLDDIQAEITERQGDLEREHSVLQKQRSMLEEDMTEKHTQRELKDMFRDFDARAERHGEEFGGVLRDKAACSLYTDKLKKDEVELSRKVGRLKAEQDTQEALVKQRLAKMEELAQGYGIDLGDTQSQATKASQSTGLDRTSAAAAAIGSSQDSVVSLAEDDLDAFRMALRSKDNELVSTLRKHKLAAERDHDEIANVLSELVSKQKSLEAERESKASEQQEARRELQTLNKGSAGHARVRQSDINDSKRRAADFAQRRDEAASNPRKGEIPVEIRTLEEKIDKLKRGIEDDQQLVQDLRLSADAQNEITVLKDQVLKDVERLQEAIDENSFELQKFGLTAPAKIQTEIDEDKGEDMIVDLEKVSEAVLEKYQTSQGKETRMDDELKTKQRRVAEKNALLQHNKTSLSNSKSRMNVLTGPGGSVKKFQDMVEAICAFEATEGKSATIDSNKDPQDVVNYLSSRLEELDEDSSEPDPDSIKITMKRLGKLVSWWAWCCCRFMIRTTWR